MLTDSTRYSHVETTDAVMLQKYLDIGWELFFQAQYHDDGVSKTNYSLGWSREKGEPVYPKSKYKELV